MYTSTAHQLVAIIGILRNGLTVAFCVTCYVTFRVDVSLELCPWDDIPIPLSTVEIFSDRGMSDILLPHVGIVGIFSFNSMADNASMPLIPFKCAAFYDDVIIGLLGSLTFVLLFTYKP